MAKGYIIDKALGLGTEYLQGYPYTYRHVWDDEEEAGMNYVQLHGRGKPRRMTHVELRVAHLYVITKSIAMETYHMRA